MEFAVSFSKSFTAGNYGPFPTFLKPAMVAEHGRFLSFPKPACKHHMVPFCAFFFLLKNLLQSLWMEVSCFLEKTFSPEILF